MNNPHIHIQESQDNFVREPETHIQSFSTEENDAFAAYARVRGKNIVVIYEKENDEDIVITAMTVGRKRLIRFGFTTIR